MLKIGTKSNLAMCNSHCVSLDVFFVFQKHDRKLDTSDKALQTKKLGDFHPKSTIVQV